MLIIRCFGCSWGYTVDSAKFASEAMTAHRHKCPGPVLALSGETLTAVKGHTTSIRRIELADGMTLERRQA